MGYTTADFYFFSGTGNSYRAARWMADRCAKAGVPALVAPMSRSADDRERVADRQSDPARLIGLCYPTHGFTAPWHVLRFAAALPAGKGAHAVVSACRGATRIGPFFLSGLEGTAAYLVALLLAFKGYRVRGVQGLDMPANWFLLHWGLHPRNAAAIALRAEARCGAFVESVFAGVRAWDGLIPLLFGIALVPVSLGYLLVARFFLSKTLFPSRACNGCGLCARSCQVSAIRMRGSGRGARPFWTFRCEGCMRCVAYCPDRAVVPAQGWTAAVGWLLFAVVPALGLAAMRRWVPVAAEWYAAHPEWAGILPWPLCVAVLGCLYAAAHGLARTAVGSFLLTRVTLSRYWRYYHEQGTSVTDLTSTRPVDREPR